MDKYGIIGFPLGHSFSKGFFTDKFEREQINATYLNFAIEKVEELKTVLKQHPELRGLNVTLPYKQAVIPLLSDMSEEAKAIGAVNVIRIRNIEGKLHLKGYNSDVIGFTESIRPLVQPHHKKALVLGTGGASKAVCAGLDSLGIEWKYVSRTERTNGFTYEQLNEAIIQSHTLIVNCSPVGMFPHCDECPLLPYHLLTPQHLLFDLVYNPLETNFMKKGQMQGAVTKNGLEMLHLQALASWKFWNE